MALITNIRKVKKGRQAGFSLIELLIAMFVLAVGLLGGMVVILTAISSNARNRMDTAAVALAQSTMDRIIVISNSSGVLTTQMTDCQGNVHNMNTAPGGSALITFGSLMNGNSSIDFSKPAVGGYQMTYALCATGAQGQTGNVQTYDVRWYVSPTINDAKSPQMILVAAKNTTESGNGEQQSHFFSVPITLRALRGN
jgi:prepilin-type N-terminal cleavage/methylation domain-containing protein